MKKICIVILAAAMLFTVSACNVHNVTKMAYVGNDAIYKGEFNFYLQQAKYEATTAAQNDGSSLSIEQDWDTVIIEEVTAREYTVNKAKDFMKQSLVLKTKAMEEGIVLTDEDLETVKTQRASIIEQYGGRYNYEQYFSEAGFTLADVERIITNELYAQKLIEKYIGTEETPGIITISDEEISAILEKDYVMAKHILVSNSVTEEEAAPEGTEGDVSDTEEPADTEELLDEELPIEDDTEQDADALAAAEEEKAAAADANALEVAKELIGRIGQGTSFDTLMEEYSSDRDAEDNLNGKDGYLFTTGAMMPEFEEAAFALEVGKTSAEPVKTDYGYHILWRLPLPAEGEEYDNAVNTIKSTIQSDEIDELVDTWAAELGLVFNEKAISNVKMQGA